VIQPQHPADGTARTVDAQTTRSAGTSSPALAPIGIDTMSLQWRIGHGEDYPMSTIVPFWGRDAKHYSSKKVRTLVWHSGVATTTRYCQELPMSTIPQISQAMQQLLITAAQDADAKQVSAQALSHCSSHTAPADTLAESITVTRSRLGFARHKPHTLTHKPRVVYYTEKVAYMLRS
jgi:hypothetical protein